MNDRMSEAARTTYGSARFTCPRKPPASVPTIIAALKAIPPHANTRSFGPVHPVASRASTSHASLAPVWKQKPNPSRMLPTAKPAMPHPSLGVATYRTVDAVMIAMLMSRDFFRPSVSAMTPVGTSNTSCAAAKAALTTIASKMFNPEASRNSVLTAQMSDADRVNRPEKVR